MDSETRQNATVHSGANRPIVSTKSERVALERLAELLNNTSLERAQYASPVVSVGEDHVALPESVLYALTEIVGYLKAHQGVVVVPANQDLTTQEAADILNVSRPYLIRLIDEGTLSCTMTGTHRRLRLTDVLQYKELRDSECRGHLAKLTQLSREYGQYE